MTDVRDILATALDRHQSGGHEEAEQLYRQVLDANPDEATALYLYGLLSFETGRADRAETLFARLAQVRPDHAESHFTVANLDQWAGRNPEAIEGFRRAIALQPDHAGALVGLTTALVKAGDLELAVETGRTAVQRVPDHAEAAAALGWALLSAGRSEEAVENYRAACALQPALLAANLGLARALLGAARLREALDAAEGAIALDSASAEAWFARGAALSGLGQPEAAAQALERAVGLEPGRAAGYLNLGNAYATQERADEAERQLLQAITLDPMLKEAHASLGSVYLHAGREAMAESCFRAALAIDPDMVAPHQNLAALLAERGEAAEARRHRDLAYNRQNLFVEHAPDPVARVLVLTTSESGNIPHQHLLPRARFTRIDWFVEYARPDQAAELPPYDLVFNAIGDADLAGPTDAPVRRFLETCRRPVLNDPAKIARTSRDQTASLLAGIDDLAVPKTARLPAEKLASIGLAACVAEAGLSPPVLVRQIGSHGGKGLVLVESETALEGIALADDLDAYAIAYRAFRSADGWHRKYRAIFVDRRAYPYHLAISPHWLVHHETTGMENDPVRLAEEMKFLADPRAAIGGRAMTAVAAIGERLDLDYCGVDFSILPDGRVLVFETNATMLVHPEKADGPLAPKNPYVRTILDAFDAMTLRAAAAPSLNVW